MSEVSEKNSAPRRRRAGLAALACVLACALPLGGCQKNVAESVGADPDAQVPGEARPAASPSTSDPDGRVADVGGEVRDLVAAGDVVAVRTAEAFLVGSPAQFLAGKAKPVRLAPECGNLTAAGGRFVAACGDAVTLIDPRDPATPQEVSTPEDFAVTAATVFDDGTLFVTGADTPVVAVYKEGKRSGEIKVEAGSDQLLTVPNPGSEPGLVRVRRQDSTIQNVDWQKDRAGGRLRVGQGVGLAAAGSNGVVLAADSGGRRLAVYTSDDVVRLHQYGNTEGTPWAVAWDEKNQLAWVTTTDNNQAQAFSIAGGVPEPQEKFSTVTAAEHIAVLDDATVVTASAAGDGVQFYSDAT